MKRNNKYILCRTTRRLVIQTTILAIAVMAIAGCNESGGNGFMAGGGIGGTGISIGAISGFGSVIVNDIDFDTRKAEVVVNGNPVGRGDSVVRSALALGMIVRVEGEIRSDGTGTAERIVFSDSIRGPVTDIESLDTVAKKLVILGQAVIVDNSTQFRNTNFNDIAVDQLLQISGWQDGSGTVRATYIAKLADSTGPSDEVTVKGTVSEANILQRWVRINQLVVDLSEITDVDVPAVGQLVFARGILDANGFLVASSISLEDELGIDDAENVEIGGIVTQVSPPDGFILGTTEVRTDDNTLFRGLEPDDVILGARLLVKGTLTNRQLLADEVIAQDNVNVEGTIYELSRELDGLDMRLLGLDGLTISLSSLTKVFGDVSQLDHIQTGQHVRVLGYAVASDKLEAIQAKVEFSDSDKVKLQGPVTKIEDFAEFTVYVFSVAVPTEEIPDDGFESDSAGAITRDRFLEAVAEGDTVSVNGNLSPDGVSWKGIELFQ